MEQDKVQMNDSVIPDAKNFRIAERGTDPLEREEREAAKKNAKPAPKGAFIVAANKLRVDKKLYKRGDEYDGKLYPDLLEAKALMPKSEWKPQ